MDELRHYDYDLPAELIASEPLAQRDSARLLVVNRHTGTFTHHKIRELPALLRSGDRLVLNDTRVLPARLFGTRTTTGGKWEGLYLSSDAAGRWRMLSQSRGKLQVGEKIAIHPAHGEQPSETSRLELTLVTKDDDGVWTFQPSLADNAVELLLRFGTVPLPPYIHRALPTADDWQRYQTTYARRFGAVAAPTAGLHFTPELLQECRDKGIDQTYVTLHVGIGTFRPIDVENLADHRMHAEWCELSPEAADEINRTREADGRIVAVGTTSVRTLESAARDEKVQAWSGETDLFIRPPYTFRAVDCLLTNFHLPKSTLLVLVSAFAGLELTRAAYQAAIDARYRFYSYGDAMLIL
ncbi:MAG: tRNA preQ1(34) S-adenosylmethionine ribosyltransferase-isomerase QueA [Planctomycetaceae bacterium]